MRGEGVIRSVIGVGAEMGMLGPKEYFTESVLGAFSVNGYGHIPGLPAGLDPFVTAGYTRFFPSCGANLCNIGGRKCEVWAVENFLLR